jgi:nucleoside-triphosphatase THEP1
MSSISILTGEIQSGKTTLCLAVADAARQDGIQIGGLLSPGIFEHGEKTAIDVLDLKTSQQKRLAELKGRQPSDLETNRWAFRPEVVAWGNQVLLKAVPCDLLLIDELGPLEILRGEGWVNGFQAVESEDYQGALVVVRPSLLQEVSRRWKISRIIDLSDPARDRLRPEELFRLLLKN